MNEAAALYQVLIESLGPLNVPAAVHSNRGAALLALDQVEEAEESWEQALSVDSNHVESHLNLAISLQSDSLLSPERLAQSQAHAEACLQLRPGYTKAHHTLANALQAQGDLQGAQRQWELAEAGSSSAVNETTKGAAAQAGRIILSRPPAFAPRSIGASLTTASGLKVTALSLPSAEFIDGGIRESNDESCGTGAAPLILQVDGLLSAEECTHIRALAAPRLNPSYTVVGDSASGSGGGGGGGDLSSFDPAPGAGSPGQVRTSMQAWLPMASDPVLSRLRLRASDLLGVPLEALLPLAEDLQVVRYQSGDHFGLHHDSPVSFQRRAITLLLYLNNNTLAGDGAEQRDGEPIDNGPSVEMRRVGGETWFPFASRPAVLPRDQALKGTGETSAPPPPPPTPELALPLEAAPARRLSDPKGFLEAALARARAVGTPPPPPPPSDDDGHQVVASDVWDEWGLRVAPREGRAVLFYNLDSCGHPDPAAIHAALPLVHGEKWIANMWIADR